MSNTKKITISIYDDYLSTIDDYIKNTPNLNRSTFMTDSSLQIIKGSQSLSIATKRNILPHLAELSNLANELQDCPTKDLIKKEVHSLWLSLK